MLLTRRHGCPILTRSPFIIADTTVVQPACSKRGTGTSAYLSLQGTCLSGAPDTPKAAHRCPPSVVLHRHSGGSRPPEAFSTPSHHGPSSVLPLRWNAAIVYAAAAAPLLLLLLLQVKHAWQQSSSWNKFSYPNVRSVELVATERAGSGRVWIEGSLPQNRLLVGGEVRLGSTVGWSIGMTE